MRANHQASTQMKGPIVINFVNVKLAFLVSILSPFWAIDSRD